MGRGDDLEEQRLATHDSFEWVSFQIDWKPADEMEYRIQGLWQDEFSDIDFGQSQALAVLRNTSLSGSAIQALASNS